MIVKNYRNKTWREARQEFLEYFVMEEPMKVVFIDKFVRPYISIGVEVCVMYDNYGNVTSTSNESYCFFNPKYNTRMTFDSEWDCEFDSENKDLNFDAICETSLKLMDMRIHFTIWFAKGMRSPNN